MNREILNFSLFFPIQIWETLPDAMDGSKRFRLEPPMVGTDRDFQFLPHFIQNYPGQTQYESQWVYKTTFWAFSPKQNTFLNRGMDFCFVTQEEKAPFATFSITPIYSNLNYSVKQQISSRHFGFGFYTYSIPGTTLLFISESDKTKEMKDIVFCTKEAENDAYNDKYNFLPLEKNRNLPFYEIRYFNTHYFMYVFRELPKGIYWKPNRENICIPSEDPDDFKTAQDCILEYSDKIQIRYKYLQSSNNILKEILYPGTVYAKGEVPLPFNKSLNSSQEVKYPNYNNNNKKTVSFSPSTNSSSSNESIIIFCLLWIALLFTFLFAILERRAR